MSACTGTVFSILFQNIFRSSSHLARVTLQIYKQKLYVQYSSCKVNFFWDSSKLSCLNFWHFTYIMCDWQFWSFTFGHFWYSTYYQITSALCRTVFLKFLLSSIWSFTTLQWMWSGWDHRRRHPDPTHLRLVGSGCLQGWSHPYHIHCNATRCLSHKDVIWPHAPHFRSHFQI